MKFSCLHTHSVFCDGCDDVETLCRRAFEKGLCSIGFSSHAPITRKTGLESDWHMAEDRLDAYLDEVRSARRRWEGRLPVYLGLEIDYIEGFMGPADRDYRDLGLDYSIGAVHYLIPPDGAPPFTVDGSREELETAIRDHFDGSGDFFAACYWNTEEKMIRAGGFDILGHADLIKKYNRDGELFSTKSAAYLSGAEKTARAAALAGLAAEINTGGLNRKHGGETYPSPAILRLFRERHVPAVISADAHRADELDGHYHEARRNLLEAGYTAHFLFEGRKNGAALWREESLE